MKLTWKNMAVIPLLLLECTTARAQRISPPISECSHKCNGSFTVANPGLTPFVSTITYANFEPTVNGKGRALPLTAVVRIDSTSARVSPRGEHTFSYSIQCEVLPCAVRFMASQVTGRTTDGLQVKISIPHVVYICDRKKFCRDGMLTAAGVK